MSKRGASSLRTLLIHGARATRRWVGRKTDRRSQWMRQLVERRGHNRTAVAVANKHARIVWALLTSHQAYEPAKGENAGYMGEPPRLCSPRVAAARRRWMSSIRTEILLDKCMKKTVRTMRGVIELMTRSVRPTSSQPA